MTDPSPAFHKYYAGVYTRLKKAPSDVLIEYQIAPLWQAHKQIYSESLVINMAWVTMLAEQKLIPSDDAVAIVHLLRDMERAGAEAFPFDPRNGEFYFNLESYLIDHLGPAIGGHLYAGRSRHDGNPTMLRLFARRRLVETGEALAELANTCLNLAEPHLETVMPGYTGSQAGQPWTLGHYLLSFVDAFSRDFERIQEIYPRVNQSLFGLGCGSGSDLPLHRQRVADLLGCYGFVENTREFITSYDAFAETVSVCLILLAHLGQMAHDLHTWCTQEFGMVELGDDFCGSSSYMPQKKNPYPFHRIRAAASKSSALMPALLNVMRTSSQDFDAHELIPEDVLAALQQANGMTRYMNGAIATLQVHADLMRDRALRFWTAVSEVATLIVRERGLVWRTAHRITERFVRLAMDEGKQPLEVTGDLLDRAATEITGQPLGLSTEAIRRALDPLEFIRTRQVAGSPNPLESARMLADRRITWAKRRGWCDARRAEQAAARQRLDEAADALSRTT